MVHVDVMDGHFVPNITIGPVVVKAIRPHAKIPFDVHLMISPVDPFIEAFAEAGADGITVHPEAGPHIHRTLQLIKSYGKRPGVVLNPGTPIDAIDNVLDLVDLVLIMTVNPGFGGQSFIESQLKKIEAAAERIAKSGRKIALEVDGSITPETAKARYRGRRRYVGCGNGSLQGRARPLRRQHRAIARLRRVGKRPQAAPAAIGTPAGVLESPVAAGLETASCALAQVVVLPAAAHRQDARSRDRLSLRWAAAPSRGCRCAPARPLPFRRRQR